MSATQSEPRLAQIARARSTLLARGAHPLQPGSPDQDGRDWIRQSWQRCLARGAEPERRIDFEPIPHLSDKRIRESQRRLLHVANPILQRLARTIAPLHYFVLLTDAAGTVIGTAGVDRRLGADARALARVGVDLSEPSVGTTAISGALREQRPVWLHRGEHFFSNVGVFSCAGAPLWDPDGQCIGMIDLTGMHAAERPELVHLVARYAREVEHALLASTPHALALALSWAPGWQVAGSADQGLVCSDRDGCVVGANRVARQMLPQLQAGRAEGWHLKDLFAVAWTELFDLAASGQGKTIPLWSGLRVHVSAQRDRSQNPAAGGASGPPGQPVRPLRAVEAELVLRAVREAGGRVDLAARALGISRATVYRRLRGQRTEPARARQPDARAGNRRD